MCRYMYILNRYPSLNLKRTENGWTTGRKSNKGNKIKISKLLVNAKIPVKITHLSQHGNSVLTLAIKYNVCEFAEYLFENQSNLFQMQRIHGRLVINTLKRWKFFIGIWASLVNNLYFVCYFVYQLNIFS